MFFFYIPIHISVAMFGITLEELMTIELNSLGIYINFVDVLISMNTGYLEYFLIFRFYEKGVYQIDRWKVLKNYLKTYFITDFFVNFVVLFILFI